MPKSEHMRNRRVGAESSQRATMLRGIYEDNLQLKEPGYHSPQRPQPPKLAMWSAVAAIGLLIGAVGLLDRVVGWAVPSQSTFSGRAPPLARAVPPVVSDATEPVRSAATNAPAVALPSVAQPLDLSIKTVVIDAGHGGHDTGSTGKAGAREKDITLDIARRLRQKLGYRPEYRVFLVRDADVFIPLNERVSYVNSLESDLFISIHVNDPPSTSTDSDTVEIYYFGRSDDGRTRKLVQLENQYWSYTISEYEERVQSPMKLEGSKVLAESIQVTLIGNKQHEDRIALKSVVGAAPLVVLFGVRPPSVLVEIGGFNTRQGEHSLGQVQYRDVIAANLAAGITAFLNSQPKTARSL